MHLVERQADVIRACLSLILASKVSLDVRIDEFRAAKSFTDSSRYQAGIGVYKGTWNSARIPIDIRLLGVSAVPVCSG